MLCPGCLSGSWELSTGSETLKEGTVLQYVKYWPATSQREREERRKKGKGEKEKGKGEIEDGGIEAGDETFL